MGCDIHGVAQQRLDGRWETFMEVDLNRNYRAFAVLAGVRNGYGFAGVATHEPLTPIAEQRGIPPDAGVDGDEVKTWDGPVWIGDHSHTWLTIAEIKNYPHWDKCLSETGVVPIGVFQKWDGKSCPESWSGGISGSDVVVVDMDDADKRGATHVQIRWASRKLRDCCRELLAFCDYALAHSWTESPDDVRLLLGFDS